MTVANRGRRMRWGAPAMAALAMALGGCSSVRGTVGARTEPMAEEAAPPRDVVTSKGGRLVRVARREVGSDDAASSAERAVPSPREIFDFHPAGSKADAWRAPFVIDTDDGPLRAEIRRSNEELRKYREDMAKAPKTPPPDKAAARACSEDDVAHAKPGCPKPPPPKPTTITKDPLAIR